jgi:flagellar hook-basal body complex protein FliE
MAIQAVGMKAYTQALNNFTKAEKTFNSQTANQIQAPVEPKTSFEETLNSSLGKVNDLQAEKNAMIKSFASGETQNVHELMISLQKASLAMKMTSAVRNKVMEAYKELSRIQF